MGRLWEKGLPLDERVLRYTAGEDHELDIRLVPYDIRASFAHATMLHDQGLLDSGELELILGGLESALLDWNAGNWQIELKDEDCHTALENRLTEQIGEAGGRIHLGRSRNDQVLAALRLYLLDAIGQVQAPVKDLKAALKSLADRQGDIELPGMTHMQQAMPSSVALWCGAFMEACDDAVAGLDSARRRLDRNPLGSAAGYGTPGVDIDREKTTSLLGFAETQQPVTSVQLSRGKGEAELLFELTLLMQDLGRLASDLLLYYTQEFSYVELPPEMTTGSSIMPQKRNPDVLELVRGASATVQACLSEALNLCNKLPSGFQRDLQRMKAPLFRGIDLTRDSVEIMALLVSGMRFRPEKIRIDESIYATKAAYELTLKAGIPFREAYRQVANEEAKKRDR